MTDIHASISQTAIQASATCKGNTLLLSLLLFLLILQPNMLLRWKEIRHISVSGPLKCVCGKARREMGLNQYSGLDVILGKRRKGDYEVKSVHSHWCRCCTPVVLLVLFWQHFQTPEQWLYVNLECSSCPDSSPLWGCLYLSPCH